MGKTGRIRAGWLGAALAAALCLVVAVAAALVWRPSLPAVPTPTRASFPAAEIERGATLASAGFCSSCHTAEDRPPYAGGRPLETPFGTIYGSNITPDRDTGIGTWSLEAFTRSMRAGIDREGRHLYPAFPYTHFTRLDDADLSALYAFVMTREPVRAETPPPALPFPYDQRALLAGWNLLFLRQGPRAPDPSRSAAWNRGAYLSEALAHCSACHAPRNALGAEASGRPGAGGEADGWWAPPLDASSPAPLAWSQESLFNYLRSWDRDHGGAVGPMMPVMQGLARLPEADVRAIATTIASTLPPPDPAREARTAAIIARVAPARSDPGIERGAVLYRGACAACHESGGAVPFTVRSLALHTTLAGPDPRNVVRVVLHGVQPRDGEVGALMPAFAGALTNDQVTDLLAYLRARFTDEAAWPDAAETVRRIAAEAPRGGKR